MKQVRVVQTQVLKDIVLEVAAAKEKFPSSHNLLVALMEEVGELARAYIEQQGPDRVYSEAKQVAGLAVRIMEEEDGLYKVSGNPNAV